MEKYKRKFEEGMRYNTVYFIPTKNFETEKIDHIIGDLERFIIELKRWKSQGAKEVGAHGDLKRGGEYIPLWE